MTLVFPNVGEEIALKALVNHTAPQNLVLRLFKNDKTPAEGDVAGDYTEADFTGYSAVTLAGGSWSYAAGNPGVISYAQQTFQSSADQSMQNIYGYYLTQVTSGILVAAERFASGPYPIKKNGDYIKPTPRITGKDEAD